MQMGMGMNMGAPQQMFMPQQQQQQQQQGLLPQHLQHPQLQLQQSPQQTPQQVQQAQQQQHNRIQEQAQTQMNNLRQQAASAHQHQQPKLLTLQTPQQPGQQQAAAAAVAAAAAAASQPPSNEDLGNGAKGKQTRPIRPGLRPPSGMPQQYGPQGMGNGGMSPMNYSGQMLRQGQNGNGVEQPQNNQNRNTNALQDYQMQLMLLEKQNKKRLDIARNSSAGDLNSMPQMQQVQQDGGMMQQGLQNAPPKASPAPSPVLNNKNLPSTKSKKATTAKKATKASAAAAASGASARSSMSGGVKRENITPLTPAADSDFTNKKRKGSTSDSPAKKASSKAGVKKEEEKSKKKSEEKSDSQLIEGIDLDKKPDGQDEDKFQPSSAYFHASLGGNDKMVSVDILGGATNGDNNFFNSAVTSGMDDVDFEFNNFLDSADAGLNDSITGFNWGNPIEGGD